MTDRNALGPSYVYFELQKATECDVHAARLEPAIALCEKTLSELPVSSYHVASGQSFLDQVDEAAAFLAEFYKHASESTRVKSIYIEMTRFEINTDVWDAHAFAYDFFGDPDDLGWLCGWKMRSEQALVLDGLAKVREVYHKHDREGATPDEEKASYAVSMLVTLRFHELIRAAAPQARTAGRIPENVPVLAAVHDPDMVMVCYGRTKPRARQQPARPKHVPAPDDGKERIYSVEDGCDEFGNSLPWDRLFFDPMEENARLHKFLDRTQPLLDTWKPVKMILHRRKWRCDLVLVQRELEF